jgi:hypothetical protein
MPLGDVTEQQSFISAYFGADSSGIPASFSAALFTGNPYDEGVEFAYPGYARVTLTNDTATFVNNADGSVTASATFPDATGAATTDDAACWVLYNGTAKVAWDFLDATVAVDGAGTIEAVQVVVYNANDTNLGT